MAAPQQWTRQQKLRGGVCAVALGAIVIVGSLTGAQLKSDKQKAEVRHQILRLSVLFPLQNLARKLHHANGYPQTYSQLSNSVKIHPSGKSPYSKNKRNISAIRGRSLSARLKCFTNAFRNDRRRSRHRKELKIGYMYYR